jgi:hypothetical protein
MKKFLILLMFLSANAYAENCKVVTVTTENNGKVDKQTSIVCKEGITVQPKIRIGDVILENEVAKNPKVDMYFSHNNSQCRMFIEHTAQNKEMKIYHGVICQLDGSDTNWLVVDKW